jgi:DNA-binding response OmpR family regulator
MLRRTLMRILVIEDDRKAASLLARGLEEEGFAVDVAHSAEAGNRLMEDGAYDLLILDWLLPGKQGLALCRELRQRGARIPILMLTARDSPGDRVAGLDTGADDYLTKPFHFEELLARVRALRRRSEFAPAPVFTVGNLALEAHGQRVTRAGVSVELTRKEYAILEILMRQAGRVVSRSHLAEEVWKTGSVAVDNLIDVHIRNLRRKIDAPGERSIIQAVRSRGFMLDAGESGRA